MKIAIDEAKQAFIEGEIPVGTVVVDKEGVYVRAHNRMQQSSNPLLHAEILALFKALKSKIVMKDMSLYTTLEPCVMCAGAILNAGVKRVVFGAFNKKEGGGFSKYDILRDGFVSPPVEVLSGVMAEESERLLKLFFKRIRRRDGRADEGARLEIA